MRLALLLAIILTFASAASSQDVKPKPPTGKPPHMEESLTQYMQDNADITGMKPQCILDHGKTSSCVVDFSKTGWNLFPGVPILRILVFFLGSDSIKEIHVDVGTKGIEAQDALATVKKPNPDLVDRCIEIAKRTADRLTDYPSSIHDLEWDNAFNAYAAECYDNVADTPTWTEENGETVKMDYSASNHAAVVYLSPCNFHDAKLDELCREQHKKPVLPDPKTN